MKENSFEDFEKGLRYIFEKGLVENNNSSEIVKNFTVDRILEDLDI